MIVVVKIGGSMVDGATVQSGIRDLAAVASHDRLIVVHGGGDQVTGFAEKLGVPQRFIVSPEGFRSRYTDEQTLDILTMVIAGKVNKEIVRSLQTSHVPAVGLSGIDGGVLRAQRKTRLVVVEGRRKFIIDGGYTGRITQVNTHLLSTLVDQNFIPVIAPVALGDEFELLNVDGDRAAARIAGAMKADALVLCTDVQGLILDGELVQETRVPLLRKTLSKIGPGMITKAHAAMEALERGVGRVVISGGFGEQPFTSALKHETGTLIMN